MLSGSAYHLSREKLCPGTNGVISFKFSTSSRLSLGWRDNGPNSYSDFIIAVITPEEPICHEKSRLDWNFWEVRMGGVSGNQKCLL